MRKNVKFDCLNKIFYYSNFSSDILLLLKQKRNQNDQIPFNFI